MKILSVNDYNSLIGGTEIGTKTLCQELIRKKHSIVYLGCGKGKYTWKTHSLPLIKGTEDIHKRSVIDKIRIGKRWLFYEKAYEKTLELIDEEKPDVAHLHNIFYQLSISPLTALNKRGVPVIMTAHDHRIYCPRGTLLRRSGKICHRKKVGLGCAPCIGLGKAIYASIQYSKFYEELKNVMIISPSVFIANRLMELGFGNVNYLHYGTKNIVKYSKPKGNKIVYVGRLTKSKGLYLLINSIKEMKNMDLVLEIVGTGPEEKKLKEVTGKVGLKDKVKFLGKKDHKETLKIIKSSLFVVIPSMWVENTPQVVFETMGLGRVIVAADIGGLPDLVKNEETGLLFEVGNKEQLKDKMIELLVDRKRLERLSKNAHNYAKREFNYDNYVSHVLHYYRRVT